MPGDWPLEPAWAYKRSYWMAQGSLDGFCAFLAVVRTLRHCGTGAEATKKHPRSVPMRFRSKLEVLV